MAWAFGPEFSERLAYLRLDDRSWVRPSTGAFQHVATFPSSLVPPFAFSQARDQNTHLVHPKLESLGNDFFWGRLDLAETQPRSLPGMSSSGKAFNGYDFLLSRPSEQVRCPSHGA